ncbi:sigma-70 family RNA polymerase sigma factor [Actinomadura sp. NPDC048021]|uniref:sigma-70 family RNA polymerase sigma factor n=1 Tax=Actinomadura sp. NPDC048021 TaxID=3155385 RepID=UPI0033F6E30A
MSRERTPDLPDDAALISRARTGDVSAYATLYECHVDAARRLARTLVEGDAAEDAVQETFTKVLDLLRRGDGPREGFRPYLLTALRHTVYDRFRAEKRLRPTGEIEKYDPGVPFADPLPEGSTAVRAFRSLPERRRVVLWHTEIERARPAEVASVLGLTPNGAAALAYRAREGLRRAYLQAHLDEMQPTGREECREALRSMGAYVRGGLSRRESLALDRHLRGCPDCRTILGEARDVNATLRNVLGPLAFGAVTATGGLGAGGTLTWLGHRARRLLWVAAPLGVLASVAGAVLAWVG